MWFEQPLNLKAENVFGLCKVDFTFKEMIRYGFIRFDKLLTFYRIDKETFRLQMHKVLTLFSFQNTKCNVVLNIDLVTSFFNTAKNTAMV
jgi:hypothetical protein